MSSRPDRARARSQQPGDLLKCGVCGRSFSRSEHLKRHELIHSNDKPFECGTCGKGFMRKDALDRHASTHAVSGPSLRQKGARACSNCAASKVKCSGELPSCSRCQNRAGAQCDYPSVSMTTAENHRSTANVPSPFGSVTPADSFAAREIQLGLPNGQMPTDNTEVPVGMQTLDPMAMNHFDQGFWSHELESTINWLPDGNQFQLDGFVVDHLDDSTFFPFLDTAAQRDTNPFHQFMPPAISSSPGRASLDQPTQGTSVNHASNRSTTSAQTPLCIQSPTADQQHIDGELYVDGQPARLPRVKRRRLTESTFVASPGAIDTFSLRYPPFNLVEDQSHLGLTLSDRTFNELFEAFQISCTRAGYMQDDRSTNTQNVTRFRALFPTPFEPEFPSKEDFGLLLHSYMTNFHPTIPIFHVTAFEHFDWQLVLVNSAIGALFLNRTEEHAHFAASLQEFLRRVLYLAEEDSNWLPQSATARGQLKLLNIILMTYTCPVQGREDLRPIDHLLTSLHCPHGTPYVPRSQQSEQSVQEWEDWKLVETRNRLSYATWLIDCMIAIHLQRKPLLTLECASLSLPCHEDLWQCSSLDAWLELRPRFAGVGSMNDALQEIYVHKRLDRRLGEFSRILILHGLFHRMWEVGAYLSHPLSQWTPTAQKPSDQTLTVDSSIWLPSVPTFARWRNATCDCIDILHWSANAAIGIASGMEHPTVLHLHFSRVVLLTPYKQIVAVAKHLVRTDSAVNLADVGPDKQIIRRWALQDQYKARLAMIHAGVLFWHVRRYSANGFYEPVSVALASLALWAFSLFSDKSRTSKLDNTLNPDAHVDRGDSEAEDARCDIILLDRPTDDELVQQYVKEGHKMSAILNGVGDLCSSTGPERVLTEGRKLLKTLTLWGVSGHWISLFDKLIAISRRQREVSGVESR